ncbi:hypothetical protein J6A31_01765 [bacterium]|nr:hypothetical protein [bacterium]
MIISQNSNLHFNARNKTIRFADDIVRKVNNEFPRISATKVEDWKSSNLNKSPAKKLFNKLSVVRNRVRLGFFNSYTFKNLVQSLVEPIKEIKVGNCGEATDLGYLAARANGLKNSYRAMVMTPDFRDYDHVVVIVDEDGQNPYVLDAWLGFADYLPKAIERYQKDFRQYFNFDKLKTDKMQFVSIEHNYQKLKDFFDREFTQEEIENIRTIYPQFIVDNSKK